MFSVEKISAFRARAANSAAFPRLCAGVHLATEILVCAFFAGLLFAPALWKALGFIALALFIFARFFRVPAATFPRFSRADLIFLGAIVVCWILLFVSEAGLWMLGLNEKFHFFRDLKNALRIIIPVFVFCRLSKKAILPCLFATAAGLAIFAGAEYWETGARVGLGFNPNSFSAFGVWLIFPALYFCEKATAGTALRVWLARGAAASGTLIAALGGSRAGVLAILCGLLFYALAGTLPKAVAFSEKRTRALTTLALAALLCLASLLPNLALARIFDFSERIDEAAPTAENVDKFSSGRMQIFECTWRAIREMEHPIFGVGENTSELPAYRELPPPWRMPHNTTLLFWLTHGTLGLASALIFQISGILLSAAELRICTRVPAAENVSRERLLRAVLIGAIWTTFIVWGLFDLPHGGGKILFWTPLAFLFFAPNFEKKIRKNL